MQATRNLLVAFTLLFVLSACASNTILAYQPTERISAKDASRIVEELTMMQHANWRPDRLEISEEYIFWNYGRFTEPNGWRPGTTTREVTDRIYFNSIKNVQLMTWQRKFKQWYVVSIVDKNNEVVKHAFYSRDESEAKRFVDALESLIAARRN